MSTQHTINDLRRHLFAALDGLSDKANPMDIERAKAISEVAKTVIDSARVEVAFMQTTGHIGSGFISAGEVTRPALPPNVRQHRLQG